MKKILLLALLSLLVSCDYSTSLCENIISGDSYIGTYTNITDGEMVTYNITKKNNLYFMEYIEDGEISKSNKVNFCEITTQNFIEIEFQGDNVSGPYMLLQIEKITEKDISLRSISFDESALKNKGIVYYRPEGELVGYYLNNKKDLQSMVDAMIIEKDEELLFTKIK